MASTKHTGGRNPPKYVSPGRHGQKVLAVHVDPQLAATVHSALAQEGVTLQKKGEELFRRYAVAYLRRTIDSLASTPKRRGASVVSDAQVPNKPQFDNGTNDSSGSIRKPQL
jgi:hypothetical protein